jgi:hypothetical protein
MCPVLADSWPAAQQRPARTIHAPAFTPEHHAEALPDHPVSPSPLFTGRSASVAVAALAFWLTKYRATVSVVGALMLRSAVFFGAGGEWLAARASAFGCLFQGRE